ncbi:MAG: hypothetical protein DDT24_00831 [Chloroflexi bacterium]|nr:hypothetical protein [Chloroflexota bacterium]
MGNIPKSITRDAGEYYVAFGLSMLGYAVALTARGTPGVDLLVANPQNGKSVAIQVKTQREPRKKGTTWWNWQVGSSFAITNRHLYWAFVDLKAQSGLTPGNQNPDVYFVSPTDIVCEVQGNAYTPDPSTPYHLERWKSGDWFVIYPNPTLCCNNWYIISQALGPTHP